MKLKEKRLTSETKFLGKLISVFYDTVELEDGNKSWREVVRHPGACAVVAQLPDGRILLEKQYRYAVGDALIEIPAGKLDKDEDILDCAQRELQEETGYTANYWKYLGEIVTSPGFCNEKIHLYFATLLEKGESNLDDNEFLEVFAMTEEEILEAINNNKIIDAKTIAAILKAMPYLETKKGDSYV